MKILKAYIILDKILVYLIKKRWRLLYKQLGEKKISYIDYAKRRKIYESMINEIIK